MSDRRTIEDRLRRKRAEVLSLEEKLRNAKVYMTALEDVLKLLGGDDGSGDTANKLRKGSAVAKAREVILGRKEPMHLDELVVALGKPLTQSSKASLVGSLAAYVRQNEIFTRTAPNTYGLVELGHSSDNTSDEDEPPAGFGRSPIVEFDDPDDVPF